MTIFVKEKELIVPGQILAEGNNYKVGNGVRKDGPYYRSVVFGIFTGSGNTISARALRGKYLPRVGDVVIGMVIDVGLTMWRLDIGSPYEGILFANNATTRKFDPVKHDARQIYDVGDVVRAKIIAFDRTKDPSLTTLERGLGKLTGGKIISVTPTKISRVIGHKGSMINIIKKYTKTNILIGQNGRIWIEGKSMEDEMKAIEAIKLVEKEALRQGLTDRIEQFLKSYDEVKNRNE